MTLSQQNILGLERQVENAAASVANFSELHEQLRALKKTIRSESTTAIIDDMLQTCDRFSNSARALVISLERDLKRALDREPN